MNRPSRLSALGPLLADREAADAEPDQDDAALERSRDDGRRTQARGSAVASDAPVPSGGHGDGDGEDASAAPLPPRDAAPEPGSAQGTHEGGPGTDPGVDGEPAAQARPATRAAKKATSTKNATPGRRAAGRRSSEAGERVGVERFRARLEPQAKVSAEIPREVDELLRVELRRRRELGDPARPATRAAVMAAAIEALPTKDGALLGAVDAIAGWLDVPAVKLLGARVAPELDDKLVGLRDQLADAGYELTRKALVLAGLGLVLPTGETVGEEGAG